MYVYICENCGKYFQCIGTDCGVVVKNENCICDKCLEKTCCKEKEITYDKYVQIKTAWVL